MFTSRRTLADGVRMCTGRAAPSRIGPIVTPPPAAVFSRLKAMLAASSVGITIGPILLGAAQPVHILTPSATVRRIVNMAALTVVDAHENRRQLAIPLA